MIDAVALTKAAIELAQRGDFSGAERIFKYLIAVEPAIAVHYLNLGCLLINHDEFEAASIKLTEACRLDARNPVAFFNLGIARYRLNDYAAAQENLARVLGLAPGQIAAAILSSYCLSQLGSIEQAAAILPNLDANVRLEVGWRNMFGLALRGINRDEEAIAVFKSLVAESPDFAPAITNLAESLERTNKIADAEALLAGIAFEHRELAAQLLTARILRRKGKIVEAIDCLERIKTLHLELPARGASDWQFELGRCLDASDRWSEAVAAFEQGNTLMRGFIASATAEAQVQNEFWPDDLIDLDSAVLAVRKTMPQSEDPVFVVGFPRSGTTLIDQILDAHPRLQVLEEKPALEALVTELRERQARYPDVLGTLNPADLQALRSLYWRKVDSYMCRRQGARLVDKFPLNFAHLHLIRAIFPGARLIFMVRHPCDAVLSCFMQDFRFTNTRHGFWSIKETAEIYLRAMTQWIEQSRRLHPDCLHVWYEDLVEDLRREVLRISSFLEIEMAGEMLAFHQHALQRHISTPSYSQVVRPIYNSSIGRWRKYRPWFKDVEAQLLQLGERLGYPRQSSFQAN